MRRLIIAMLTLSTIAGCNAEGNNSTSANDKNSTEQNSGENQPKVNINVNKEYDEDGNLIKFDSTYSSYYSNIEGDTVMMDSLFSDFNPFFKQQYPGILNQDFDEYFFNDSLLAYDFFKDDFFSKRYELNDQMFKNFFEEMDSLKKGFFEQRFKGIN